MFKVLFGWIKPLVTTFITILKKTDQKLLALSVEATEISQKFLYSPVPDLLVQMTPTNLDDKALLALRKWVPVLIVYQKLRSEVFQLSPEQLIQELIKVAEELKLVKDKDKAKFFSSLAADIYTKLQEVLADKKITFGEAVSVGEVFFRSWNRKFQYLDPSDTPTLSGVIS